MYYHLVCHPLWSPILTLLVPIALLLRHIEVGVFPAKFIAMFASYVGVTIVIAVVSTVAALSIVATI